MCSISAFSATSQAAAFSFACAASVFTKLSSVQVAAPSSAADLGPALFAPPVFFFFLPFCGIASQTPSTDEWDSWGGTKSCSPPPPPDLLFGLLASSRLVVAADRGPLGAFLLWTSAFAKAHCGMWTKITSRYWSTAALASASLITHSPRTGTIVLRPVRHVATCGRHGGE